jgi:hypothetical protein
MRHSVCLALLLLTVVPGHARAQQPDFLFGKPKGAFAVRSGWFFAHGGSDLFSFVREQLTIDKKDFNGPSIAFDVDMPIKGQLSAIAGFEYYGSSTDSEYRHFVDNNRLPITQTTELDEMAFSYGVKFALTPAGRAISAHAWIPSAVTPYVGAAGGALWYKFHQEGDFVNFQTLDVQPDTLDSRGWTPSAAVFGGLDVKAWRRVYLNAEARFLFAKANLGRAFSGFEPIDLTGLKITGGIRYMF